jgi:hypothetical protein
MATIVAGANAVDLGVYVAHSILLTLAAAGALPG